MTRVYGLGRSQHHSYPSYAPKVVLHRLSHWLIGPLLGCSCSGPGVGADGRRLGRPSLLAREGDGCFNSPWRIEYPARNGYRHNVRLANLERAVRDAGIEVPL